MQALADEGVKLHPDRRAALQLLHRPEVARLRQERDGQGPRRGAGRGDRRRQRLPRRRARATASSTASTSAAATTAASGTPRAATTRSPRSCSTSSTSMPSRWSTSRSAPAPSSRCASCRGDKVVVLGLVSSKLPALESADDIARRIEEAEPLRAARQPRPGTAVRLRLHHGRQPPHRGRAVGQDASSSST